MTLVWFDATITTRNAEIDRRFRDNFDIRYCSKSHELDELIEGVPGAAICFEYDYPDRPGMSLLCNTKERHPKNPVLMLTTQHSEQLAVWAYRNKVIDYLVQPVSDSDIHRCVELLHAIQMAECRQETRPIFDHRSAIPAETPVGQQTGGVRLAPAVYYVQQNFRRKIRNSEVAKHCGMSLFHFSHVFAETFEVTFQDYVVRYRILEACKELLHPNVPVTNVAHSVGFNDPSYFARVFRRFIGVSPSEYCEFPGIPAIKQKIRDLENILEVSGFNPAAIEPLPAENILQHKTRGSFG